MVQEGLLSYLNDKISNSSPLEVLEEYLVLTYNLLNSEKEEGTSDIIIDEFRQIQGFRKITAISENPNTRVKELTEQFMSNLADPYSIDDIIYE